MWSDIHREYSAKIEGVLVGALLITVHFVCVRLFAVINISETKTW